MTASTPHTDGGAQAPPRRHGRRLAAFVALFAVVGTTSLAAAAIGRIDGSESFAATFEARAVADPTITSCRALPAVQKIVGRYQGAITVPADERRATAQFAVEILYDRTTGVGTAEGTWQLGDPPSELTGKGKLIAVVTTADPPSEAQPPDPDLELHGVLVGTLDPPDPDLPAQKLVGNFSASLGEGATFPHLKGSVGDPTVLASNPAALIPAVKC